MFTLTEWGGMREFENRMLRKISGLEGRNYRRWVMISRFVHLIKY
jgi:hypothetical protein